MAKAKESSGKLNTDIRERLVAFQKISAELISHRDLNTTLQTIIDKSTELLHADAASLYLKDKEDDTLNFEIAINRSINISFSKRSIPISDMGIANYVFKTGKSLNIPDV